MTLYDLLGYYRQHTALASLAQELSSKRITHTVAEGLYGSAQALVIAGLFLRSHRHQLIVMDNADDAAYLLNDLKLLLPPEEAGKEWVCFFPASFRIRQRKHGVDAAYEIERTATLNRLSNNKNACIVVTYPEALTESVVARQQFQQDTVLLKKGQEISIGQLQQLLLDGGWTKVDFVYEPGQFSIRGGIVDIFSYSHEMPYRIDFFGDEIDSIRTFDIETQLSKNKVDSIEIIPDFDQSSTTSEGGNLFDYFPETMWLICNDMAFLHHKLASTISNEPNEPRHMGMLLSDKEEALPYSTLELCGKSVFNVYSKATFHTQPQPIYHKNFDLLDEALQQYAHEDYQIYILSDSQKQIDRLQNILREKQNDATERPLYEGRLQGICQTLHAGFTDSDLHICCLTDHQLFERFHKVQQKADTARQGKVLLTLKELNQLQVGDYVVHVDHGIGRFGGLVHTTVNGKRQEMIKLIYRDNDILFVSIHSLHRISKYKGKDGGSPNISKLGSGQWERMKERTKSKVKDIARDLIQLYAQRRQEKGFAYSPDSYLQHELEASFLYEDTPDQQKATIEMKHDMESPIPMDRLICGDVGFGKTEIAMRAAFKAATDGKQTAVLVPTTVLALQHYNSFKERFKNFPITVEYLSRAKTTKQVKEIVQRLAAGEIDILIGTHKIVGKTVQFKDLGLLIIDEEQKFGVATKEKLRQLKVNVDTLTLTATPIPRTLQFSLLGARDLSIMHTPPPNRYPVQTEIITPDDEDIIQEAIRLELNRNGQVFVISNLIQHLPTLRNKIQRLVPEARIALAHGQMPPEDMESILTDFINYDYDVLIATSIIESGVDIPNVNTIIINSAHRFGLSDLHQMRGRVGRSNRKAYCYLVAPASELLTPDAKRRLQAIETFADLGSGFHIAMQDLDIRGAGNMLGAEQSGFIADLGYETYQRILNEAVLELKEEEFPNLFADDQPQGGLQNTSRYWVNDSQLESDLEIGFPETYVENISERITLYRELDNLQQETELVSFEHRLIDRFGTMPPEAQELLMVVRLRWKCMALGIEKIVLKMSRMVLYFPSNIQSPYYRSETFGQILTYIVSNPRRCQVRDQNGKRSAVIANVQTLREAYEIINKLTNTDS
ncbi:MAG: transcription-repair coupling factor [Paludibacter sp.]|nr:transcription-repair coupling factor [Bacteroidales bacterium]MCM1069480.1 transcription-repair coupling factor [Prevotella sp.]MCM1354136.1 transcription-repair coupling factor [Bacteroides sp.]MCM1443007.1 transcription-repair coupling factor [Muribaculum sp.]MCM1482211.1 transcription-repair coupling factor [Paludibacter sp.]